MKNLDLKKLAKLTAHNASVDLDIASFVLNKLGRRQLLAYLRHLKAITDRKTVRVFSQQLLPEAQRRSIVKHFPLQEVLFEQKPIGDGIKIQINDTIIDFSMHSYIDTTIEQLKNSV